VTFRALLSNPGPVDIFAKRVTRSSGVENQNGEFVLYWMQAARRLENNIALRYAREKANESEVPLVVYEPPYPAPNERIRAFALAGAADNLADARAFGIRYVNDAPDVGRSRLVVTDEFPTPAFREQTKQLIASSPVAVHVVDGNGVFPMRAFDKEQYSAKTLRDRARRMFEEYWHPLDEPRGSRRALNVLRAMTGRASGLSPYLHFGHVGIHEVVAHVLRGAIDDEEAEAFLEQAIIRRELSFNMCFYRDDVDSLSALPDWARRTIDAHRGDRRSPAYTLEELERAATHDPVWNLAQRQLIACGTMHNYLRMLWGKKIIEWSGTPEDALAAMLHLFNEYSFDGRDPNTYAGALWCLGKHDRPWFPERPIFGTLRYMSSESTARKVRLAPIEREVIACEASARTRAMF
jgi:hypothetical protein